MNIRAPPHKRFLCLFSVGLYSGFSQRAEGKGHAESVRVLSFLCFFLLLVVDRYRGRAAWVGVGVEWGWRNTKSSLYCQNTGSHLWSLGLALPTPSHCGLPHGLSLVADLFHATPICSGLAPWGTLLARLIFRHYGSVLDISLFAGDHPHCLVLLA